MIKVSLNLWDFLIHFEVFTVKKKLVKKLFGQALLATWYK